MQLKCKIGCICQIVLLLLFAGSASATAEQSLVFSSGAAPNDFQTMVTKPTLTEALHRIGYELKVNHVPSSRSVILADRGQTDGDLARVSHFDKTTKSRFKNLLRIDPAIVEVKTAVFTSSSNLSCTPESMKNKSIAYKRGRKATARNLSSEKYDFSEITPVTNDMQALEMLTRGRVDYVELGLYPGLRGLKVLSQSDNYQPCIIRRPKALHAYIHKKHKDLLPKLQQTLNAMKADGTLDKLNKQALTKFLQ